MSNCITLEPLKASFLIAFGAIPGSLIRFKLLTNNLFRFPEKYLNILFVNTLATFLLGLLYGLNNQCNSGALFSKLTLFLGIGFLGSLSTFSTFIYEAFDLFRFRRRSESLLFLILSVVGGLLALRIGYLLS